MTASVAGIPRVRQQSRIPSPPRQRTVFLALLLVYALLAAASAVWTALDPSIAATAGGQTGPSVPPWVLGLANAGLVLVGYGLLGLASLWFARRLDLPGMFREAAGWRAWVVAPMGLGALCGMVLVLLDRLFVAPGVWDGFAHPPFPYSLLASAAAGVGEEIAMRGFVLGLWALLLDRLLRRWRGRSVALWTATFVAALTFGASHLPSVMLLLGASDLSQVPTPALAELFLLNGLVGIVAGRQYIRQGLVAAAGVHFWADVVWHVIWPLASAAVLACPPVFCS